jgi:hypothetical protein
MCQVLCGQCEFVDRCGEAGIDVVEGSFEASWGGAVAWQGGGETRAEETIVGSGEAMGLIILLLVLLLLFGGGGFYYGPPYHYYGGGLGLVLLIVVIVLLFRRRT